MRVSRRAGVIGAVVGVTAAALATGVAVQRTLVRRGRDNNDIYAHEPFGDLAADEVRIVTSGGVDLYVEIVDPTDGLELEPGFLPGTDEALPTLVFVHGFCLDMGTFHFQRKELTSRGEYRMVFYDQPGHGRSGRRESGEYELHDLGEALYAVIEGVAADGPVILIGHSMGGMTIMALAEQHADFFAEKVKGVILMATSGRLFGQSKLGLPTLAARFAKPLLPLVHSAARITGPVIDQARLASADLAFLLTRRYGFGGPKPSPALVSYVERMNSRTSAETVARYLRTLSAHARHPALAALRDVPTLVIVGDSDVITPPEDSEEIVRHLPDAQLVTIADSGHAVMLEHADEVNAAVATFLDRIGGLEVDQ